MYDNVNFLFVVMKLLLFLFYYKNIAKNRIEENVLVLLTKWRAGERGPFLYPLPSLEVVTMPEVSGKYAGLGTSITYSTSQLKLSGLKEFSVTSIDISEKKLEASAVVSLQTLAVSSDKYKVSGNALWFIPISGAGNMTIFLRNIEVQISIRLRNDSSRMWVDNLQLSFQVGGVKANLEGGPRAVVVLLDESGVSILQSNHDAIVKALRDILTPSINLFIANLSPEQLFSLVEQSSRRPPQTVTRTTSPPLTTTTVQNLRTVVRA